MPILVTLNTKATPPVTVSPTPYEIMTKGSSQITWSPAANQNFTFVSVTFAPSASHSFGAPTNTGAAVYINDDNSNNGTPTDYPYTVIVSQNGMNYSSDPPGPAATGGKPVIRNH